MMIILYYVIAIAVGILTFIGFFWKMNWVVDLTRDKKSSVKFKIRNKFDINQLPPVYPNGWYGLLESSSLKKGQVEHVAALGENFAVFRTEKGIARVLNAYCPHLGANMAEGGEVKGEELQCHFHRWQFCGETGKCTSIPYSKNAVPSSAKTKVWESMEINETIFVWYHAESSPPEWYPEPIKNITNGTWKYQGRNEFYVNSHIQEIPENGADWSHLQAIHKAPFVNSELSTKIMRHEWNKVSWEVKGSTTTDDEDSAEKKESQKHIAVTRLRQIIVLFSKYDILELNALAEQCGPGYVEVRLQSPFGTIFMVQNVLPLQPFLHKVTHRFYGPFYLAPYARLVLFAETMIFKRDVMAWNYKRYVEKPILVGEEANIKKYRKWFKQFYTENSPTYESCNMSLEW